MEPTAIAAAAFARLKAADTAWATRLRSQAAALDRAWTTVVRPSPGRSSPQNPCTPNRIPAAGREDQGSQETMP
eukprot:SAG31_NODE_41915_length_274_cov_0.571429_1_plen_73_part_01